MMSAHRHALEKLRSAGWTVQFRSGPQPLPAEVRGRYAWLPAEVEQFVRELELAVSPDEKAWLLGLPDFQGSSSSAFKWDEFEQQSLAAAAGDVEWANRIKRFWDLHFPVGISVKSGYAYFAVQGPESHIVSGAEPEFEETTRIAPSLLEFLNLLATPDANLVRLV